MSQGQHREGKEMTMAEAFGLVYFLVRAHSLCFLIFLRKGIGREEPGFPGLAALGLMLAVGSIGKSTEMLVFAGLWLVFLVIKRAESMRYVRQGMRIHSRSLGYPAAVMVWFRMKNPDTAIQLAEPLLVFTYGVFIHQTTSTVLGGFMISGCFSMVMLNGIHRTIRTRKLIAMEDARLEQEDMVRMYRKGKY